MRGTTGNGTEGNTAVNVVANLAKRGSSISGSDAANKNATNQSITAAPNMIGPSRVRRTSHGLPLLGQIGGALAALRTQRSNSAITQQSAASIPEPALWEVIFGNL
jgi:hypothetical protein